VHDQQTDVEGAKADQPVKTSKRNDGRKNEYDMTVHPRTFTVGQWVWYYYPRRYQNRTPKWCKTYDGPFLITKVIPPCDYVIQKTVRSAPITVHRNKLKICYGATPKSWLANATQEVQRVAREQDGQDGSGVRQEEVSESSQPSFVHNLCDVVMDNSKEKSTTATEKFKHREFCHSVTVEFLAASKISECKTLTFGCRRPR